MPVTFFVFTACGKKTVNMGMKIQSPWPCMQSHNCTRFTRQMFLRKRKQCLPNSEEKQFDHQFGVPDPELVQFMRYREYYVKMITRSQLGCGFFGPFFHSDPTALRTWPAFARVVRNFSMITIRTLPCMPSKVLRSAEKHTLQGIAGIIR